MRPVRARFAILDVKRSGYALTKRSATHFANSLTASQSSFGASGTTLNTAAVALSTGQKLLRFDRRLGARLVAGTDEAGRGSLAGPLVVAGVLLDYGCLRDLKVRPLGLLNDSKQVTPERREMLFRAVIACAERVVVRVIPHGQIDPVENALGAERQEDERSLGVRCPQRCRVQRAEPLSTRTIVRHLERRRRQRQARLIHL